MEELVRHAYHRYLQNKIKVDIHEVSIGQETHVLMLLWLNVLTKRPAFAMDSAAFVGRTAGPGMELSTSTVNLGPRQKMTCKLSKDMIFLPSCGVR